MDLTGEIVGGSDNGERVLEEESVRETNSPSPSLEDSQTDTEEKPEQEPRKESTQNKSDEGKQSKSKEESDALAAEVTEEILRFAKDEMKHYLATDIYTPEKVKLIYSDLCHELIEIFQKSTGCCPSSSGSFTASASNGSAKNEHEMKLECLLSRELPYYLELNDINMKKATRKINKIVQRARSGYVDRMESLLKNNPSGINSEILHAEHVLAVGKGKDDLEAKIKDTFFGVKEPVKPHLLAFQTYANDYFKIVEKVNSTNLKPKALPPLIFQLQSNQIRMGILVNGKFQIVKNHSDQDSTPLTVGLNTKNELVLGGSAKASDIQKEWRLTNFLFRAESLSEEIHIGKNGTKVKIGVEFLLGFILQNLKIQAERQLGGVCPVTTITVPIWFTNPQRLKVEKAAEISGFSEVHLINEPSAAAYYAFTSVTPKNNQVPETKNENSVKNVLVLSENMGRVDGSAFSWPLKDSQPDLTHCGSYHKLKRRRSIWRLIWRLSTEKLRDELTSQVCEEALKRSNSKIILKSKGGIPATVIVTSYDSDKFKSSLEKAVKAYQSDGIPIIDNVTYPVIHGAALLSQAMAEKKDRATGEDNYDVWAEAKATTKFNKSMKQLQNSNGVGNLAKTRAMDSEQIQEYKSTLHSIFHQNDDSFTVIANGTAKPVKIVGLAPSHQKLLDKCLELEERQRSGAFRYKSDRMKKRFKAMIQEARGIANDPGSNDEQIQLQMNRLQNWNKTRDLPGNIAAQAGVALED